MKRLTQWMAIILLLILLFVYYPAKIITKIAYFRMIGVAYRKVSGEMCYIDVVRDQKKGLTNF